MKKKYTLNSFSLYPGFLIESIINNRSIIYQMTKREILGKYKGSAIGLAWSFFNPLLTLMLYTIVFSEIFQPKWDNLTEHDSKLQYALILFVGLIIVNFFCELMNKSPFLIITNVNLVKKIIFPLEILPIISACSSFFHTTISLFVLLTFYLILNGYLNWTIMYLPLLLVPLIFLAIGISMIFASLGVYLRDLSQFVSILSNIIMFATPVFYPISSVPPKIRSLIELNPLSFIVEQTRACILWNNRPDLNGLFFYTITTFLFCWFGFAWFQKTKKGFADVV